MSVPEDTEGRINFCLQFLGQIHNKLNEMTTRVERMEAQLTTVKGVEASLPQSVRELKREMDILQSKLGVSIERQSISSKTPETLVQTNPKLFEQMKGSIAQSQR